MTSSKLQRFSSAFLWHLLSVFLINKITRAITLLILDKSDVIFVNWEAIWSSCFVKNTLPQFLTSRSSLSVSFSMSTPDHKVPSVYRNYGLWNHFLTLSCYLISNPLDAKSVGFSVFTYFHWDTSECSLIFCTWFATDAWNHFKSFLM